MQKSLRDSYAASPNRHSEIHSPSRGLQLWQGGLPGQRGADTICSHLHAGSCGHRHTVVRPPPPRARALPYVTDTKCTQSSTHHRAPRERRWRCVDSPTSAPLPYSPMPVGARGPWSVQLTCACGRDHCHPPSPSPAHALAAALVLARERALLVRRRRTSRCP